VIFVKMFADKGSRKEASLNCPYTRPVTMKFWFSPFFRGGAGQLNKTQILTKDRLPCSGCVTRLGIFVVCTGVMSPLFSPARNPCKCHCPRAAKVLLPLQAAGASLSPVPLAGWMADCPVHWGLGELRSAGAAV
jgi:hypothetical protein